ncbi:hypothetical protein BDF22DRAFT_691542 [Syncephalis plumigaleata]|nr:hypothetical protein BDF22DRAFT_691542 [Syncephalis plumigaleata]
MVCQSLNICKLPIIVLWRVFAFLDDDSLLIFLSSCYHILDAADKDDSTWESWFRRRFGDNIDTKTWIKWHDQKHGNYRWIRHCIGRLCLEKNWRTGACSSKLFNVKGAYYFGENQPSPQIIFSNIWGTLIVIANKHFHYFSHGSEHRSLTLKYPSMYTLHDGGDDNIGNGKQIESITGLSNERFIVIAMSFKNAETTADRQKIFYWRVNELESKQEPYIIHHLDTVVQLKSLQDDWLLLQETLKADQAHSAYIVNLAHVIPIPVKTAAQWNTYTIVDTTESQCIIYAGLLNTSTQHDSALYSWDKLCASLIDVRPSPGQQQQRILVSLRVDKQGERQSKLLTSNIVMVWQATQKDTSKQASVVQTTYDPWPQHQSSSAFGGNRRNTSVTSAKFENMFFIHNINDSTLYYSGEFLGHTPTVSFHNKQIIILNGSNLKLVNLTLKQTVFETTVANGLVHLGFVLDNYWVAQHPGGGFFTMSMDNQPQIGWIPTDDQEGIAAVNNAAIVKLSGDGRKLRIWNMHQNL